MDLNLCCAASTSRAAVPVSAPSYCACASDAAVLSSCCRPTFFYAADGLSRAASSASMSVSFQYPSSRSTWSQRSTCTSSRWPRATLMESAVPARQDFYTVGDFMTRMDELLVVKTSTTVDEALEALVQNRITGLPVVDDDGKLIGVVSDFDLLALDAISGKRSSESSLFPEAGSTWKAFKELQKLISKTEGRTVGDVMTPSPLVVRGMTNLEDAARLLLETKYRRLPVVDDNGRLIGLLTRGNVIRAALKIKREAETKAEGA